jgi:very-short-patch-repair endonuclease
VGGQRANSDPDAAIARLAARQHGVISVPQLDYEAHRGRSAFEADRSRDLELKLLGYEVITFTWRQLIGQPPEVAAILRMLLDRQHE